MSAASAVTAKRCCDFSDCNVGAAALQGIRCYQGYSKFDGCVHWNHAILNKLTGSERAKNFYEYSPTLYRLLSIPVSVISFGLKTVLEPVIAAVCLVVFPILALWKGHKEYWYGTLSAAFTLAKIAIVASICFCAMSQTAMITTLAVAYSYPLLNEIVHGMVTPGKEKYSRDGCCESKINATAACCDLGCNQERCIRWNVKCFTLLQGCGSCCASRFQEASQNDAE